MIKNSPFDKVLNITKQFIKECEGYIGKGKCNNEYVKQSLSNCKGILSAFENPRLGSNPYAQYTIEEIERANWNLSKSMELS